jgi:hypothetical protein
MSAALRYPKITVGLDLGDRVSHLCAVDARGAVVEERTLATTLAGLTDGAAPAG